ncbi:hypothetical protein C1645_820404 [Glomus cerebriforme]|uniref:Uncharacterized protein n=1 Tax=Glomus cerebriforme TaxID=658196 RepID=A0A397TCP9_9GLOM|nr:hypothetical protein C1645_820404 [Glomus cerebriforme]
MAENCEMQLISDCERKKQRRLTETSKECQNHILCENKHKRELHSQKQTCEALVEIQSDTKQSLQKTIQHNANSDLQSTPLSAPLLANTISEKEHILLQKFCNKMDNIQYNTCPKFSAKNNMDSGETPEELKNRRNAHCTSIHYQDSVDFSFIC